MTLSKFFNKDVKEMEQGNLGIRVFGSLDMSKTMQEINRQVRSLEKNNIKPIDIDVKIDGKGISEQIKALSAQLKQLNDVQQKHNNLLKEERTITQNIDGSTTTRIRQMLKTGEIIEKETTRIKQQGEAVRKQIQDYEKLGEVQRKIMKQNAQGQVYQQEMQVKTPDKTYNVKADAKGRVIDVRETENIKQQKAAVESLRISQEKLNTVLHKLRVNGNLNVEQFRKFNGAINNTHNIAEVRKLNGAMMSQERFEANAHKLRLARIQAEINASRIKTSHKGIVDVKGVDDYVAAVKNLTPYSNNLNQQLAVLDKNFSKISQNAKNTSMEVKQAGESFGTMLSKAMVKFPVWMLSATLFYAPIRAMQDMTTRLVEIDTLMVTLQRVMNAPDYRFPQILEESVEMSDRLASKLTDVLSIMGDFARLGKSDLELSVLAESAQVLQNVSDLDAKGAVDTITAAMNNFNIEAKDSIDIIDKLNEVDNNFAISTQDLSDGMRKAASTAHTFGVDINELIGYIAAIGSTTRESGAIIGNGLKTVMSRITTLGPAEDILNSVGVSIKDMGGGVREVSDILSDLAGKWSTLSAEQQQNIGVTVAGRYQLSR